MKPARENDNAILRDEDGNAYGVLLAADYTAEHEYGLREIRMHLGLTTEPKCFDDRCISEPFVSEYFKIGTEEKKIRKKMWLDDHPRGKTVVSDTFTLTLGDHAISSADFYCIRYREVEISGAWSWSNFIVRGHGKEAMAVVKMLAEGLETGDFGIWVGGGSDNPFNRGGLCLVRPSLVPQSLKDLMNARDADRIALEKTAQKTKIEKVLEKAGRGYFALSPRWNKPDEEGKRRHESKFDVVFWLNPREQSKYKSGLFTVEDLKAWALDLGPIIKDAA